MSSKQIRVGQRWRRRDGSEDTILRIGSSQFDQYPVEGEESFYDMNGRWTIESENYRDLIELIEDAPGEQQPQAAQASTVRYYCVPPLEAGHKSPEAAVKHAVDVSRDMVGIVRAEFVDGKLAAANFVPLLPPKQYVWMNVYEADDGTLKSRQMSYPSKESADKMAVSGRVGRMKVELEARWDE